MARPILQVLQGVIETFFGQPESNHLCDMLNCHRYYPKTAFAWLYYREKLLAVEERLSWSSVERALDKARYSEFPLYLRGNKAWWKVVANVKLFHKVLCDARAPFEVRVICGKGLGIFASRRIIPEKESIRLFGFLRRLSHETACKLDELGETSMIQFRRRVLGKRRSVAKKRRKVSERLEWYYLGGPAKLLNHACESYNAEYCFEGRGSSGEFFIQLTREIKRGEEVLVHYGPEFWSNNSKEQCLCRDCNTS